MRSDTSSSSAVSARPDSGGPGDLLIGRIAEVRVWLGGLDAADLSDRDRIRVVAALEEMTGAVAGAQVRMTAAYASSQRALGCSHRGVAAEVGLARRVGLSRATRLVATARTLATDLPETLEHLETGRLSEARAALVAARVDDLDAAARLAVDALLADDLSRLGDAEVRDAVDAAAMRVDAEAVEARRRAACRQRRVTVRPAADGMAWLTVHTTAVEAAAALNTLHAHADSVLAGTGGLADLPEAPEGRTHAEVMADAALSRLTGRSVHEGPPVEVALVMTDTVLLPAPRVSGPDGRAPTHAVARVVGVGPVPASIAREMIRPVPVGSAQDNGGPRVGRHGEANGQLPPRLFEGPDWEFDPRTDEQRAVSAGEDEARWLRDEREAIRVTVRRVHVSADGRNPVAVDARRRVMSRSVRQAIAADREPGPGASDGPDDARVSRWFARLQAPARPDELASLTSPQRCARGLLRLLVVLRDQRCRVPWCTAPIRHVDHVQPHRDRPVTEASGLTGDCAGHNLAKEDPGHDVTVTDDGTTTGRGHPHTIVWNTPTGHTYTGIAPPVLGWGATSGFARSATAKPREDRPGDALSPLESHLAALLAA